MELIVHWIVQQQESSRDLTMANETMSYPEASRLVNKAWRNADTQRPALTKLDQNWNIRKETFSSVLQRKNDTFTQRSSCSKPNQKARSLAGEED